MNTNKNRKGFINAAGILAVLLLVITLAAGTSVINNNKQSFNINEKAATDNLQNCISIGGDWDQSNKKCVVESGKNALNVVQTATKAKAKAEEECTPKCASKQCGASDGCGGKCDASSSSCTEQTSCDANGTKYELNSVVVYDSSKNDYRKCTKNGWTTICNEASKINCEIKDLTKEYVPNYLVTTYENELIKLNDASNNCINSGDNWDQSQKICILKKNKKGAWSIAAELFKRLKCQSGLEYTCRIFGQKINDEASLQTDITGVVNPNIQIQAEDPKNRSQGVEDLSSDIMSAAPTSANQITPENFMDLFKKMITSFSSSN